MSKRRATNEEAMGGRETQRACEHRGAACEQRGAACEQRGAHADDPTHPTAHAGCERSSRAACDRRGVSVGMLVGSGRVESYVLDVASMHASALAFSSLARCEYTLLASRRSASRPHVRVHGPPRATTTRPTEMVAPSSRSHAHRVHRRDDNNGRRQRGAQGLSTGLGTGQLRTQHP